MALLLAGCSSNTDGRLAVQGNVTFEGKPVESGTILFSPTTSGQYQANGQIMGGFFSIDAPYGPSAGDYQVSIEGFREAEGVNQSPGALYEQDGPTDTGSIDSYIPAKYNRDSELRVTITKENCDELDFAL